MLRSLTDVVAADMGLLVYMLLSRAEGCSCQWGILKGK
jgi:hypothetical protein